MSEKSNEAIPTYSIFREFTEKDNKKFVYKINLSNKNQIYLTVSKKQEDIEQYNSLCDLTGLSQIILCWLSINYTEVSLVELENCLIDYWEQPSDITNTLIDLQKKESIVEKKKTYQLKTEELRFFLLGQLLGKICEEIESGKPYWLNIFPLLKASGYEYIKEKQINNHIKPIINFLQSKLSKEQIVCKLESIIELHHNIPYQENFSIGNIINLLIHLNNGLIKDQDFSEMSVWEADFTNAQLYNVQFSRSDLSGSSFLQRHLGMVLSVDVSPNGKYIAAGDIEGYVRVFDVGTGKEIYSLRRENYWASVWVVRFDPSGQIIASAGDDHRITLWQFEDSDENEQLTLGTDKEHNDSIRTIVFVDKNTLISGSGDHNIRYWNISNQRKLLQQNQSDITLKFETQSFPKIHNNSVRSLAVSKNRTYILSGSSDRKLILWKKKQSKLDSFIWEKYQEYSPKDYETETDWGKVREVAFLPNDNSCFAAVYDSGIVIFKDFKFYQTILFKDPPNKDNGLERWVLCLAVDPTGKWLATGDEKGYVKLWRLDLIVENKKINQPEYEFQAHNTLIRSLVFIDKTRFVTGSVDCSIKTWNIVFQNRETSIQNIRKIQSYSNWIWSLIYSIDGKYLISSHGDSKIRVWKNDCKFDSPIQVIEGHSSIARTMTLTCDGKFLATGSSDCLIKLWETKEIFSESSPIQNKNLKGHQSWVRCIRSHPKNSYVIASCGDDTTIRLWDIRYQKCYQVLENTERKEYLENKQNVKRHTDPVRTLSFSESGQYIASGGGDKKIIVWKLKENTDSNLPKYEFFDSKEYIEKQSSNAEWVWSIVFVSNQLIAVGGGSKRPIFFKVNENNLESSNDLKGYLCSSEQKSPSIILKYNSKTQCTAIGGTDREIIFWQNFFNEYKSKAIHEGTIRAMAFSPDGKYLVTGGQDEHLYLWNVEDGALHNKKLLVNSPYVNVKLDLVSGLIPEEIENISKLISYRG